MRPRTSRSALPRQTSTGRGSARACATATSTTSGTCCISAVAAGAAAARAWPGTRTPGTASPRRRSPPTRRAGRPRPAHNAAKRRGEAGDGAAARSHRRPEPRHQRRLVPALDAVLQLDGGRTDLVRPMPSPSATTCPAIRSRRYGWRACSRSERTSGGAPTTRRSNAPRWKTSKASSAERRTCCSACSESWLPTRVFTSSPRSSSPWRSILVVALAVVDQLTELEHVHAGVLAVDEQHAHPLVLLEHRLELAHARHGLHDQLAGDPHRQLEHLPERTPPSTRTSPGPGPCPASGPGRAAPSAPRPASPTVDARHARDRCWRDRLGAPAWRRPSPRRRERGAAGRRRRDSSS